MTEPLIILPSMIEAQERKIWQAKKEVEIEAEIEAKMEAKIEAKNAIIAENKAEIRRLKKLLAEAEAKLSS